MLSVVCWKWRAPPGYRSEFGADQVHVLRNMVRRHLHVPHRFICVTDDPTGIADDVEVFPLWRDFEHLQAFVGNSRPSCYRRLKAFAADGAGLGERILSVDLDCVIVNDITPLVERDEDLVIWGDTARNTHYNGGLWLLRRGTRRQVWETFDPDRSPVITHRAGIVGSDQAWISHVLGPNEAKWSKADGVYSFRLHVQNGGGLPANARIVMFHGQFDPWQPKVQFQHPWIKDHYR